VRVLFDEGTPVPLRTHLAGHDVVTGFEAGWAELSNGELLDAAEAQFDVLVTTDKQLRYQQNRLAVCFAAVADTFDDDVSVFVVHSVDHAVIADPNAKGVFASHQFAAPVGPRLHRQSIDCAQHAPFSPSTEPTKVLVSRAAKTNAVLGHCASDGVSLQRAG
jgi:hypothetical protein